MSEFKISRLRYTWKGKWSGNTDYIRDDVVEYAGSSWVCVRKHTSSLFASDQSFLANPMDTDFSPAWIKMLDGRSFVGEWNSGTLYSPGEIVSYGGVLYLCTESHTSDLTFADNSDKWVAYTAIINWVSNWEPETRYGIGHVVKYNGIVYRCIIEHSSGTIEEGLEANQVNWSVYHDGVQFVGAWAESVRYRPNDLVKYGGSILRCNIGHTSGTVISSENFSTEFSGFNFYENWDNETQYAVGDVVKHGGFVYKALRNNVNSLPSDSFYQEFTGIWGLISKAQSLKGQWLANQTYKTGDLVKRGGNLYVAIVDTTADGSTLDYLDSSNWELVQTGQNWRDHWELGEYYAAGDLVNYRGSTWSANFEHIASYENFPSYDNGSGVFYWDLVLTVGIDAGLSDRGELLTYDLYRGNIGDQSTMGVSSVPLDKKDKFLSVDENRSVYYKVWGNADKIRYVSSDESIALDDITDPDRGINPFKPWRTIKYACDVLESQGTSAELTTIKVLTGKYEEILPIIVPANVAIVGDELRSVHVLPRGPISELANDSNYSIAALKHIKTFIENILRGATVTPTEGNNEVQVSTTRMRTQTVSFVPPVFNEDGNEIFNVVTSTYTLMTDSNVVDTVIGLLDTDIQYIDFHLNKVGSDPVMIGSNTAVTGQPFTDSVTTLELNKEFIAAETSAYIANSFPNYDFNTEKCKRDVRKFIEAIQYDMIYTGNYKSLMASRWYRNAITGSQLEDMFYLRNATGLRNLTLRGLTGSMAARVGTEPFSRPTGGSFTSLDPGWGPADERTWIHTRSPYIQNITTFGNNATGQKVDGALHNGGLKSFVSNDFTQIISDGIGAHVLNNGRAELVSVFTYYSQVGMFAEHGGIIRATNGNSSYGTFGALALQNDPTEIPRYGYVNNRTSQAIVASAFAGEINDEILHLEFSNAGQGYTRADYTFIGSGTGAQVIQDEVRDNAIFEMQVKNAPNNAGATPGGAGYSLIGNNVQTGSPTTAIIASNDDHKEAELLGLRLVITSGDGTGQYGYVTGFNENTKVVQVARESDGKPGWDHIIPGTPIVQSMTTNASYKFEPRITFDPPEYSATTVDLGIGTNWANIVYGETYESFSSLTGTAGTGITTDILPFEATWNVVKNGRTYEVSMIQGGAGYEVGQIVIIDGAEVGGLSGENDVKITITRISDDSTNSIMDYTVAGIGRSGRFVVTPSVGRPVVASGDGETWLEGTLPSDGEWKALAAGDNKFVAIKKNSNQAAYSTDGNFWTAKTMPVNRLWNAAAFGDNVFLAVSQNLNSGAYSLDGQTWFNTTLPTAGDSTLNEWVDIAYGKGQFVVLANSNNMIAHGQYDKLLNSWTWGWNIMDTVADSTQKDWVSITYGNNRFVAISSTGDVAYSFDAEVWYPATMPTQDGSTIHTWTKIRYGQGVFFAIGNTGGRTVAADPTSGPSRFAATSPDGIHWTNRELSTEQSWGAIAFGSLDVSLGDSTVSNNTPMWVAVPENGITLSNGCKILTGATAIGRAVVEAGRIKEVKIWNPGSGYRTVPKYTITDPNNTVDAYIEPRLGDGVLAQPSWINRGKNYKTSSTQTTLIGDGYADIVPTGQFVTISDLTVLPGPGAQFRFRGESNYFTVATVELDHQDGNGKFTGVFRIGPTLSSDYNLEHNTRVEIRERYSQVRITGHDFLDVGTGNFEQSNYPTLYTSASHYQAAPENEIVEIEGGRVFYTSTDQDGNFRTGELFAVEQATGIVTISADFFDLQGLTELALGGVRLGGSGAVIREFSTDTAFTADSNNVVPTQRAIKAYLQNRLNIGGSDLLTASFIAGTIKVGPNLISNPAGLTIKIPVMVDFSGAKTHTSGSLVAQAYFYKSFKNNR